MLLVGWSGVSIDLWIIIIKYYGTYRCHMLILFLPSDDSDCDSDCDSGWGCHAYSTGSVMVWFLVRCSPLASDCGAIRAVEWRLSPVSLDLVVSYYCHLLALFLPIINVNYDRGWRCHGCSTGSVMVWFLCQCSPLASDCGAIRVVEWRLQWSLIYYEL